MCYSFEASYKIHIFLISVWKVLLIHPDPSFSEENMLAQLSSASKRLSPHQGTKKAILSMTHYTTLNLCQSSISSQPQYLWFSYSVLMHAARQQVECQYPRENISLSLLSLLLDPVACLRFWFGLGLIQAFILVACLLVLGIFGCFVGWLGEGGCGSGLGCWGFFCLEGLKERYQSFSHSRINLNVVQKQWSLTLISCYYLGFLLWLKHCT